MSDTRIKFVSIVIEPNDDGYLATCEGVQGAFAEGDSIEEAIFHCIEVLKTIAEYRRERGESLGIEDFEFSPGMRVSVSMPVAISNR